MNKKFNKEKLKKLVNESCYKKSHIASYAGVETKTINDYVNGRTKPSLSVIKLLSSFFKIDENELLKEDA